MNDVRQTAARYFAALGMLCCALGLHATASLGAQSTPAPSTLAARSEVCPVATSAIVALDTADARQPTGRSFAAILSSPLGPGEGTGSLWVNASGQAYRVPFARRQLLSDRLAGDLDPIVFTLPAVAHLENAFVSDLADVATASPAPCTIGGVWSPGNTFALPNAFVRRIVAAPKRAPIEAQPITDPSATCRSSDADAQPVFIVAPETPPIAAQQGVTGVVHIDLELGVDSEIATAQIVSSASQLLNIAAIRSARASRYRTRIVACRPVAATYDFAVEFNQSRR